MSRSRRREARVSAEDKVYSVRTSPWTPGSSRLHAPGPSLSAIGARRSTGKMVSPCSGRRCMSVHVGATGQRQAGRGGQRAPPQHRRRTGDSMTCMLSAGMGKRRDELLTRGRVLPPAGERPEDQEGLLQGQGVPQAHHAQGHSVQDRQGVALRPGCAEQSGAAAVAQGHHAAMRMSGTLQQRSAALVCRACPADCWLLVPWCRQAALRPQAVWLRWSDQARLPQEGAVLSNHGSGTIGSKR